MSDKRKTFSRAFRPAGDGLGHVLGELESQVMEALWALGRPATVREMLGRLASPAGPAYNTVMTVMLRLTEKGLLRRSKHEGVWHYEPTLREAEFRERVSGEVLRGLLRLAPEATLSQLVELLAEDEPAALDDLIRLIDARRAAAAGEEEDR